ncbi:hypothetical protein [Streptomyces odontomachi]|uniref:hypothetical protein n=1 Tax=Streptomyces odontomachi TaxID=2944940 RepID=UPI00210B8953|nr:hypothetical protein [Streptomyces sp. ODS25]
MYFEHGTGHSAPVQPPQREETTVKKYKKLILAGVIAVALAGGTGAAMAAGGGSEKGHSSVTKDDGKPGFHKSGVPGDGTGDTGSASDRADTHSATSKGKGKDTESYRTAHKSDSGAQEQGKTDVTKDDGKPGFQKDGTAPANGEKPETHTYRAH